jgi:hypothetical protein
VLAVAVAEGACWLGLVAAVAGWLLVSAVTVWTGPVPGLVLAGSQAAWLSGCTENLSLVPVAPGCSLGCC